MAEPLRSILIVGGGTAGWMTASYLRRLLEDRIQISLIEAPSIPRIGVGEATVPSIKEEVFDFLGIPETEWMPACNATFKLGIRYMNWRVGPNAGVDDHFYHLFGEQEDIDNIPLSHFWLRKKLRGEPVQPLARQLYVAAALSDHEKSPLTLDHQSRTPYAYHFDALIVARFLQDWAKKRGVIHIEREVDGASVDERGWIKEIKTNDGATHTADLYIDCTGFRGLLINQTLHEPFISYANNLICDSAVALNVREDDADQIRPYTRAVALKHGWVWEIPLYGRSGNGYVYCSRFCSKEDAEKELVQHLGTGGTDEHPIRHIRMRVGRTRRAWVNNCVSIGLSNSFIEPLESTGIYFTYAAIYQLAHSFPDSSLDPALRDRFNERVAFMVDDVRDFIVMHYCTTEREDTEFWRTCKYDLSIPDTLTETLALYNAGVPVKKSYSGDLLYKQFEASFDRFWTNSNYLSILTGMGKYPQHPMPLLEHRQAAVATAERRFEEIAAKSARLTKELPSQYEYLRSLKVKAGLLEK